MKADYLRLYISAASIDEDIIGDILHPLKALQQRHILLDKHPTYLFHHSHYDQILDNLLKVLEIPSRPLSSPNGLIQLLSSTSHQVLTIIIPLEIIEREIGGSSKTDVVVDSQRVYVALPL